ncbi:protein kinase [Streptomyces sp. NPDC051940]|uniref:protein kinase domain-containing protein n=1 Tax=Streptomyces sp. NPDC051940 TaxID=3155675 RepID=UPI0034331D63
MSDQQPKPPYTPTSGDAALKVAGANALQASDPVRVGPYAPLGLLGSGGMGRVYLARPADDRPGLAAVKVIRPEYAEDAEFRRRFEREAAVHGRVRTPHAPMLLGTGFHDGVLWMATQYVPGINLAEAVRESGRLGTSGLWRLIAELGRALTALGVAGVVHRDLKPSNVLLSPDGAHVIDFGISQAADSSSITVSGSRVGTPAYMSPEYLRDGRCDAASDVFSLAGTVIYAATGRSPFGDGTGVDVMHRVAFEEPRAEVMGQVAAVDATLADLLAACLAKDPAARLTAAQLTDVAAARAAGVEWPEPLNGRLRARKQAREVLEQATVQQTDHLRTPTMRVTPGAPIAGFGPPPGAPQGTYGPPAPAGAYGPGAAPGPGTPPGAYSPGTPPGAYGQPTAHAMPGSSGAYGGMPPYPGDTGTTEAHGARGRRGRGKTIAAVVAGVAVCAVAVGAFQLTRQPADEHPNAGATSSATATPSDGETSASPSASASSGDGKKKKDKASASPSGTATSGDGTGGSGASADPTATSGGSGSGGSGSGGTTGGTTASPSPGQSSTAPTTPPWISQCTYYYGTENTVQGDTGQRVVQLQCMLTKRGYSIGSAGVDGEFGSYTLAAVKRFQTAKGIVVDGEVGPQTWGALRTTT